MSLRNLFTPRRSRQEISTGSVEQNCELCEHHERIGTLFEDPDFKLIKSPFIAWLRPHNIYPKPLFVKNGFRVADINQGRIGDCWFLVALTAICGNPTLFERVVPPDQSFEENSYTGKFRFNFWKHGKWVSVEVDDRLPVYFDKFTRETKLLSLHSDESEELWPALVEKAFAKFHGGSYEETQPPRMLKCEAIEEKPIVEALVELTGGLPTVLNVKKSQNLLETMKEAFDSGALIGCATNNVAPTSSLVQNHGYNIISIMENFDSPKRSESEFAYSIKMRNTWGASDSYKKLTPEINDKGEFTIEGDKFLESFDTVHICYPEWSLLNNRTKSNMWRIESKVGLWHKKLEGWPMFRIVLQEHSNVIIHLEEEYRKKTSLFLKVYRTEYDNWKEENDRWVLKEGFFGDDYSIPKRNTVWDGNLSQYFELRPGIYAIRAGYGKGFKKPDKEVGFMLRILEQCRQPDAEHNQSLNKSPILKQLTPRLWRNQPRPLAIEHHSHHSARDTRQLYPSLPTLADEELLGTSSSDAKMRKDVLSTACGSCVNVNIEHRKNKDAVKFGLGFLWSWK